ncbi:MAG: hypothetical protein IKO99_10870 [Bacteroidales bacterium]|nr:hypothetical protein [Bacteroidales bacterium]
MKRTFLRILPLAVAVLLATSCSKDENNDNAVVNNGQENVQTKTLPISITVNQKSLSKLSCANGTGVDLQPIFVANDQLKIYKGEDELTTLTVTAENISNGGKTATFEGEIPADGLVEGETKLTAAIGTQITEAQTATSREDAVQKGCYQTAEFTYSSEGNEIQLEEQNAYIEVVCKNKEGKSVVFTFGNKTVPLTLNDEGQGWIVVPAGQSFTCEALGIMDAKTTAKGNIYGISRTTVTWDNTNVFIQANSDKIVDKYHTTQTFEGIEISMSGTGQSLFVPYSGGYAAFMFPSNSSDIFTFKAPSGKKFTKIEIIDNDRIYSMNVGVWTLSEDGKSTVWSGTASSSVALTSTDSYEISSIVFTLVDAE